MKINKVTITGADCMVNPEELETFQNQFPFVEWGILFSKNKEGQKRYPSQEWIRNLNNYGLSLSAHFCGWFAKQVIEEANTGLLDQYKDWFGRFQLNYNFKYGSSPRFTPLVHWCHNNPEFSIILQYNNSNRKTLDYVEDDLPSTIHFLYDSSGGRGEALSSIDPPFSKRYTGYAGGINSHNVNSICKLISSEPNKDKVWIDMETGVRDEEDNLSIQKVEEVLIKATAFV